MTNTIRKTEITLHMDSTLPSDDIFSSITVFIEKEVNAKYTVITRETDRMYRA